MTQPNCTQSLCIDFSCTCLMGRRKLKNLEKMERIIFPSIKEYLEKNWGGGDLVVARMYICYKNQSNANIKVRL